MALSGEEVPDKLRLWCESNYTYTIDGRVYNKYGKRVGCYSRKYGRLFTKHGTITLSRLLWLLHYGRWPGGEVDHIDGNTHNDSIDNLRECSRTDNAKNRRAYKSNSTGFKGVYQQRGSEGYVASIQNEGARHYLGTYSTAGEAAAAYNAASLIFHKDFSSLNDV